MQALKVNINNNPHKVSLLNKIFVWSVLFEPLVFFTIVPQHLSGVGSNISRILQFCVLMILLFRLLVIGKVRFPNLFSKLNQTFSYFFIYAIVVGIFGYIFGSYTLHIDDAAVNPYPNIISEVLQSSYFRPIFEYFIALYYFVYFAVLMPYMLITKADIDYFFRWFIYTLIALLIIGYADLMLQALSNYKYDGIGSYLSDDTKPGNRFHSLIGEPRDAFNYLILSFGILTLSGFWENKKNLTFFWIIFIVPALYLTQSFSGILGVIFSVFLLTLFYLPHLTIKKQILLIFGFSLSLFIVYINVRSSYRMGLYFDGFASIYQTLENGDEIESHLRNARNNIYPIWSLWLEVKEFNFSHLLFGNGFGSSSVINNYYYKQMGVINPNASIVRMIYETGIIGILLFLYAFIRPIKLMYKGDRIYNKILFLCLLILGAYLSHRSVAPFIFLGVSMLVFLNKAK